MGLMDPEYDFTKPAPWESIDSITRTKERPMRVRDLPTPIYLFVIVIATFLAALLAWAILSSYVFPPEPLPKTVNVGYVGLPYVS